MTDYVVIGIILIIIGLAAGYIVKAKKRGIKCIGCPMAGKCAGKPEGEFANNVCSCHHGN